MSTVKFVTAYGEELSSELMIQQLMLRVSKLEEEMDKEKELVDTLLERISYLEAQ